ncbi:MAG: pyrroline-5-carboxylate reductase [Chloroflexi bacterium]|nr:pyrroline-5-carboxylate reductase [Chloroflexota bacterium]|tara:strand:- start:6238 stop:7044 length:807 start_codon:yes stop_codon:yes gene_type:complete
MNISFIGGGIMAEAMIKGILQSQILTAGNISIGEISSQRREYLEQTYKVKTYSDNLKAINNSDIIILSVKPQNVLEVSEKLSNNIPKSVTIISIVAGLSLKDLTEAFNLKSIIRVMPNTPAQIGSGMTVWLPTDNVSKKINDFTKAVLESLGKEIQVKDENYLNIATALSASGPAYVFLFISSLIDAGVYLGIPRDLSRQLVLQTVLGSCQMLIDSNDHPSALVDRVTSPGGTTIEALLTFEQGAGRATIMETVIAAYEKSIELGQQN